MAIVPNNLHRVSKAAFVAAFGLAVGVSSFADSPVPVVRPEEQGPRQGAGEDPRTRPVRKPGDAEIVVTTEEWTALEVFMRTHSPNKWQMYVSLPDKPLKQNLKKQITQRFRNLQRVERNDPVRWKLEIDAIKIEDGIYATLQTIHSSPDDERERILRADVDRLVANRDHWRKERLLRVKAELESMKLPVALKSVEEELQRLEKMTPQDRAPRVDKRIEDFKKQVDKPPKTILGGHSPASGVPIDATSPRSE